MGVISAVVVLLRVNNPEQGWKWEGEKLDSGEVALAWTAGRLPPKHKNFGET